MRARDTFAYCSIPPRRASLAVWAFLFLLLSVASVFGQQRNAERDYHDFVIHGVNYHVPDVFRRGAPKLPPAGDFAFRFWLSDRAPVTETVTSEDGSRGDNGIMAFWPAEPGRPSNSVNDFVVLVSLVAYSDLADFGEMQATWGTKLNAPPEERERYYGLDCIRSIYRHIDCLTEPGLDPGAYFLSMNEFRTNPSVSVRAYSATDHLVVIETFPLTGWPRWVDVLCQTFTLIRTWRVSSGPLPDDCKRQLSLK